MDGTPLTEYHAKIWRGELEKDEAQHQIAERLQSLFLKIQAHCEQDERKTLIEKMFSRKAIKRTSIKSLYIYGGVGRGKSMLMDLFFSLAPTQQKRRVHFHEFMDDVHTRLHARRKTKDGKNGDPLIPLAQELVKETWLLCFDEFFVHDIADATILSRLFTEMFKQGLIMVATSNIAPDDLYKGGLQREHFLPFIELLKDKCEVLELESPRDYRLNRLTGEDVYITPAGKKADEKFEDIYARLTQSLSPAPREIELKGRKIHIPQAAKNIARFSFADLCEKPLGAVDYLKLTEEFQTIFIDRIPQLTPEERNEAKRFVTLIDTLYEKRVRLICTAEAEPENLYAAGDGAFDFERTASRLREMQSQDYLEGLD